MEVDRGGSRGPPRFRFQTADQAAARCPACQFHGNRSPILRNVIPPQHGQAEGAAQTIRSRGRCSGSGRRTGRRRSKEGTVILVDTVTIWAAVSACAASASKSASCSSSWSSSAPRSEDWPNRSCRSFLIVNLSFSINCARYCASLSAAVARSSTALRAWRWAMISACALARSVVSESSRLVANNGITSRCACARTVS
jgi:hypothetical protein